MLCTCGRPKTMPIAPERLLSYYYDANDNSPGVSNETANAHHKELNESNDHCRSNGRKVHFLHDDWLWDPEYLHAQSKLHDNKTIVFHESWSNGTAGIRGTKKLTRQTVAFWEVHVSHRVFGTSIMFGVGTDRSPMHIDYNFCHLLGGYDDQSWGLSHKGTIWHACRQMEFCPPFRENTPTTISMLFDGPKGSLRYFKDGVDLGVAFSDIWASTSGPLYPMISSTAARTEMSLGVRLKAAIVPSLIDCALHSVANYLDAESQVAQLPLPAALQNRLTQRWSELREC